MNVILEFLDMCRKQSKAFKNAATLSETLDMVESAMDATERVIDSLDGWLSPDKANEVVRNATAYGWEIGNGTKLASEITASPDNPFLNPDLLRAL